MRLARSAFLSAADAADKGNRKKARKGHGFLHGLLNHLASLRRTLGITTRAGGPRPGLHPNWGAHVPAMARSGAEMMETSPHVDRLPFAGTHVREATETLAKLEEGREQVEAIAQDLADRIIEQKNVLAEQVTQLRQTVDATAQNPQTDPDVKAAVVTISANFRRIYKDAIQSGVQARHRTIADRTRAAETTAAVEADRDRAVLENTILRGGSITTGATEEALPLAAKRTTRRAGRKTPR